MPSQMYRQQGFTKRLGGASLALTLLLAACGQVSTPAGQAPSPVASAPKTFTVDPAHRFLESQVVVGLGNGLTAEGAAKLVGGRVVQELPRVRAALIALPQGLSVEKAVRVFAGAGTARYAEPNYLMTRPDDQVVKTVGAQTVPGVSAQDVTLNDPQLSRQWFLRNMNAPKAWETATGKGVRIGVADEDIDRGHPDLKANIVFPGFDAPNNKLITPATPYDGIGQHGTWVSGTAAAVGNNGIGGAGVAYQAGIVPLTITHDPEGASNVDSASAFVFGVVGPDGKAPGETGDGDTPAGHHGYVDIVNYSFGGTSYSQLSKEAIDYLLLNGVVFVTSAGNTPTTGPASPAWSPGVISVAATTPRDIRTDFSNRGSHLSVAAPGQQIWTTARRTPDEQDQAPYAYVAGTSFASPATAGAAALILQASATKNADGSIKGITLTPAQVRHVLENTAYKPGGGYSLDLGNGVVRADKAVTRATQNAAATVEKGATVQMRFVASSRPDVGVPLVGVTLSGGKRLDQLLYAQSAAGDGYFATGTATYAEVDAGIYKLYASGPRSVITGGTPAVTVQTLTLDPGDNKVLGNKDGVFPLAVTLPTDAFEPNNTPATAASIDYGIVRDGVLDQGDADYFKFTATAGDNAFVNTQTVSGSPDLKVSVLDATGKVVASNEKFRDTTTDAALVYQVPTNGTYTIKVEGQNTGNPFNTYWVGLTKLVGSETEPNGSATASGETFSKVNFAGANTLEIGQARDATLSSASDVDIYTFTGEAGQSILADVNTKVGGAPDTVLGLFSADGTLLATNDDTNTQDSTVEYTLDTSGKYYLAVAPFTSDRGGSQGDYRISLTRR